MHNEKVKKVFSDLTSKMEQLTKKHGIKLVGGWASTPEHLTVMVYDAPGMEDHYQVFDGTGSQGLDKL